MNGERTSMDLLSVSESSQPFLMDSNFVYSVEAKAENPSWCCCSSLVEWRVWLKKLGGTFPALKMQRQTKKSGWPWRLWVPGHRESCVPLLRIPKLQLFPLIHSYRDWGLRSKSINPGPTLRSFQCSTFECIPRKEEINPVLAENTVDSLWSILFSV